MALSANGFAKSDVDNIDADELARLKGAARQMLSWDEAQIAKQCATGAWLEVDDDV